jgi:flavin-binding protein dodecin
MVSVFSESEVFMDTTVIQRIQLGLREKRQNLSDWLTNTPPAKKKQMTGPCCDEDVQAQLITIDKTLDQIESAWVQDIKCVVKNGKVSEWRINMKVTFLLK